MSSFPEVYPVLLTAVLVACAVAAWLAWRLRVSVRSHEALNRLRHNAQAAEQTLVRRLRLTAHDIRGIGMSLSGHADQLVARPSQPASAHTAGIASAAADLLDLADDLQDQTTDSHAPRMLREEEVSLALVLDESITAISEAILPGRRNWRIAPRLREISLRCDRRALRHAITRVLTDAMRNTRHDDWIDIGIAARADGLAVVIADEGKGTATPEPAERNRVGAHSGEAGWDGAGWQPEAAVMRAADSRGIGSRLALARGLMDAHGGRLEVEAWAGVGTKVSLVFPGSRVAERARTAGTQDGI